MIRGKDVTCRAKYPEGAIYIRVGCEGSYRDLEGN